jgi:hypothetical protein
LVADDLRETIAAHFRMPERQAVIQTLIELPNFFEGWFTAETLFALRRRWPDAQLSSNANYRQFGKPDVVFVHERLTAVLALKHIATRHPDGPSRWDGAKGSTVAKDIESLIAVRGDGLHDTGRVCERKRLSCIACSVAHLSSRGVRVAEPKVEALLENGSFHLIDFAL